VSCDNVKSNLRCVQSRYRLYCDIGCDSGVAVRVGAEDATAIYILTLAGKNGNDWAMQHLPYPAHTHTKLLNDPLGSRGEKLGEEAV
jgi:hypothetical protein